MPEQWTIWAALAFAFHVAGAASCVHVIMTGRTPQGAIAWIFFLIVVPYLAVPLYWIFGPRRYNGYIDARAGTSSPFDDVIAELEANGEPFIVPEPTQRPLMIALERLVRLPVTSDNYVELLENGDATFEAIFRAIDDAEDYVLLQFFIVRADRIGNKLRDKLHAARSRGVRVAFLFDEIGSRKLDGDYVKSLCAKTMSTRPFSTTRKSYRFQLNFRNHRKLVIVDGRVGFIGGLNLGDEYMGEDPKLSPWRDTFARVTGPSVQALQLSFLEDWHWATDEIPDWNWQPAAAESEERYQALVLPTGPADSVETGSLLFVSLFNSATTRLWISTPYFVFDSQILSALQIAALRGVDVRIMLPERSDYQTAYYAGWSFHEEVLEAGCRLFRYKAGFLHQKVVLVDDDISVVGTMNLDNRSMRLNFEISLLVEDERFAGKVEAMLVADFAECNEVKKGDLNKRSKWFRFKARTARLFAPIL